MKKKHLKLLSLLALGISLVSLALSAFVLSSVPQDQTHLIDDLYSRNRELTREVEDLKSRLDTLVTVSALRTWDLEAVPWADSTGAEMRFSAEPMEYRQGDSARLLVEREGMAVTTVECTWNGTAFTAQFSLDAQDGYSYYCLLSTGAGAQKLPLASPDHPEPIVPVYLKSSLSAYCNLLVNDWQEMSGSLMLTDAAAQVQLPLASSNGAVNLMASELVLRRSGEEVLRIPISMEPSEVAGSFDVTIPDTRFPLPELEEGESLELYLEVILSDGRRLSALGISWQKTEEGLSSAVG